MVSHLERNVVVENGYSKSSFDKGVEITTAALRKSGPFEPTARVCQTPEIASIGAYRPSKYSALLRFSSGEILEPSPIMT